MDDPTIRRLLARVAGGDCRALLRAFGYRDVQRRRVPSRVQTHAEALWLSRGTAVNAWAVYGTSVDVDSRRILRALRARSPDAATFVAIRHRKGWALTLACDVGAAGFRRAVVHLDDLRNQDIALVREIVSAAGAGELERALTISRALDRDILGDRFFTDLRRIRDRIAAAWTGLPSDSPARESLALLLITRLIFLCFLQDRGLLAGRWDYFARLLRAWSRGRARGSFYRMRLGPLFFGVLNRRPEARTQAARALGPLPYLNGGLFELHPLEHAHPELDMPDDVVLEIFSGLLDRYRFSTIDAAGTPDGLNIDPEMLGRLFEGLMPDRKRSRTGTFYTPAPLVEHVVRETFTCYEAAHRLDASTSSASAPLESIRVLDPACGSGAFLLGAVDYLTSARAAAAGELTSARRSVIADSIHGVDLLPEAALICSLRLWLALVPDTRDVDSVPPLPNLDRRIRQGDSLIDPLTTGSQHVTLPHSIRSLLGQLKPLAREYISADPPRRLRLRQQLASIERELAQVWITDGITALRGEVQRHRERAADHDLFGVPAHYAAAAGRAATASAAALTRLCQHADDLERTGSLPFFSFPIHFSDAADGFDVILTNPPWLRAHNWPESARRLLREQYRVCADAGWPGAAAIGCASAVGAAQVDLALLFLELGARLLRPGGVIGILLPAKLLRSLYAGGARALLLREFELLSIEDYSCSHRTWFDADAFTCLVIARRGHPTAKADRSVTPVPDVSCTRIRVHRARGDSVTFEVPVHSLPLVPDDPRAPWVIVPPEPAEVMRKLQRQGSPVGRRFTVRRGVMTSANNVLLVTDVQPKIGDLARIRSEGARAAERPTQYSGLVEASCIRPALRGRDVGAWKAEVRRHLLWAPHNDDETRSLPLRLGRYLRRHAPQLPAAAAPGTIQRASRSTFMQKVCWADISTELAAVAVPATRRSAAGLELPWVPLNTVYFVALDSEVDALLLAACMNSTVLRAFAAAIAERAKDGHHRYFAWTVSALPLPIRFADGDDATELVELSRNAHRTGTPPEQQRLDRLVARMYGLSPFELDSLSRLRRWMQDGT